MQGHWDDAVRTQALIVEYIGLQDQGTQGHAPFKTGMKLKIQNDVPQCAGIRPKKTEIVPGRPFCPALGAQIGLGLGLGIELSAQRTKSALSGLHLQIAFRAQAIGTLMVANRPGADQAAPDLGYPFPDIAYRVWPSAHSSALSPKDLKYSAFSYTL
jgi:hypothetical protein